MNKLTIIILSLLSLIVLGLLIFRIGWVSFIDSHEFGYKYDTRTGVISAIVGEDGKYKTGYYISPPILVKVNTIDLRPMQVCINANTRVLNCKLVMFNPDGFKDFLNMHGRDDYYTVSAGGGKGNLYDILMSYAYDGSDLQKYPFLTIDKELNANSIKSDTLR